MQQKQELVLFIPLSLSKSSFHLSWEGDPDFSICLYSWNCLGMPESTAGLQRDIENIQYKTTRKRVQYQSSMHGQTGIPFKDKEKMSFSVYVYVSLKGTDLSRICCGLVFHIFGNNTQDTHQYPTIYKIANSNGLRQEQHVPNLINTFET